MSTKAEREAAALHGEAMLRAKRPEVLALTAELRHDPDLVTEVAGIIAGSWFASPATAYGHELVAAGLLLLSGPVDRDQLEHWIAVGRQRHTTGNPHGVQ